MLLRRLAPVLLVASTALLLSSGHTVRQVEPEVPSDICFVAPPTPYDPRSGVALLAPRAIPRNARCPVCGGFVSRAPDWAAQLIFRNGDTQFFDSPLSLFIYLRNVNRYTPGRRTSDVAASYVRAMGDGRWTPSQEAVYVTGSSLPGPMRGGNLPAFLDVSDAQRFMSNHGGEIVHPANITAALLQSLNARHAH